jgi:hypothetical protein
MRTCHTEGVKTELTVHNGYSAKSFVITGNTMQHRDLFKVCLVYTFLSSFPPLLLFLSYPTLGLQREVQQIFARGGWLGK